MISVTLMLYPVPVHDKLNIDFTNAGRKNIWIYQMDGKLIETKQTDNARIQLNFGKYNSGAYLVFMLIDNQFYRRLVIKQ